MNEMIDYWDEQAQAQRSRVMTAQEQAELNQRRALAADLAAAALFNLVTKDAQARLDAFARTRNYDSILSACTYAGSGNAKFAAEGAYCMKARDDTWAKLYAILADVKAGARPMPPGYAAVEPELPALSWPA